MKLPLVLVVVVVALASSFQAETPTERGGKRVHAKTLVRDGELTSANVTAARQLDQYDNGGHFDCGRCRGDFECTVPSAIEKTRNFVWEHWQAKKRGYIRLSGHSVDRMSTWHIFIEPDADGVWQVIVRIVRDTDFIDDQPTVRRVERSITDKGARLIFRAANNDELRTF